MRLEALAPSSTNLRPFSAERTCSLAAGALPSQGAFGTTAFLPPDAVVVDVPDAAAPVTPARA